jgi:hypothetical protein
MLINRLQHQLVKQANEAFTIPYTPLVIPLNDVVKLPAPPASCARATKPPIPPLNKLI